MCPFQIKLPNRGPHQVVQGALVASTQFRNSPNGVLDVLNKATFVILTLATFDVLACPNIVGTWQSSKELSIDYNTKYLDIEPHTVKFMNDVYGVLKVTYTESTMRMHGAPTRKIEIKGKEYDFVYEEMTSSYEVVSCDNNSVTILTDSPYSTGEDTIHFIDENTVWVPAMPGSDRREYFKRLANES